MENENVAKARTNPKETRKTTIHKKVREGGKRRERAWGRNFIGLNELGAHTQWKDCEGGLVLYSHPLLSQGKNSQPCTRCAWESEGGRSTTLRATFLGTQKRKGGGQTPLLNEACKTVAGSSTKLKRQNKSRGGVSGGRGSLLWFLEDRGEQSRQKKTEGFPPRPEEMSGKVVRDHY